jgi:FkbM family methyltransferase
VSILHWAILLLGASLAVVCWLLYRCLLQHGHDLLRIQYLERQLAGQGSSENNFPRREKSFPTLRVNDQYDLEAIVANVLHLDEYGISGRRLDPGDVVIDVGANIGVFSYRCHVLGSRAIFCYEPGAQNFKLLESNLGSLPGVHLFQAAVWRSDYDLPVELVLSEGPNSGAHSVLAAGHWVNFAGQQMQDSCGDGYPAKPVQLDEILERFGRVKILKIDCEGSEFPILLTSRRLDLVERIVGEVHELEEGLMQSLDAHSRVAGYTSYRLDDVVKRLESFGFHVTTRRGEPHIYVFDACRREHPRPLEAA